MQTAYPIDHLPHPPSSTTSIKDALLGSLKLCSFIASAFIAAYLVISNTSNAINITFPINTLAEMDESVVTSVALKQTTFPDVGRVITPHLEATLIGNRGEVPVTFLVDSGAKISALPTAYIDKVGLDRDTAKRIYLRSATNTTTYGYLSEVKLRLNNTTTTLTIPVAYADIIEPLLGTHGFFDQFTIIFENGQTLIIKQKT